MTKRDIINKVKTLNLPKDSYIVFGSGPLAAAGIREVNDIDLLVSEEAYEELEKRGWRKINKGPNDSPLTHDVFEAHDNWNFSSYNPTLKELLANAVYVDEVPLASLSDVKKWKVASRGAKHLADIELIDSYNQKWPKRYND
ncbi:MAG: hypothetical protein HYV38_03340 [Candidatus Levybacteria bacterium]|nr:hypothetical protein [Candidatus Levybacteria bacterium]